MNIEAELMQKEKECVFCTIKNNNEKSISSQGGDRVIFRDEKTFAFYDRNPAAQTHILLCPLEHIPNVRVLNESHLDLLKHMKTTGEKLLQNINPTGTFR